MGEVIFKPLSSGVKNQWEPEEQTFLLKNHEKMFIENIAAHLGKTVGACKNKAFRMGCSIKSKGNK